MLFFFYNNRSSFAAAVGNSSFRLLAVQCSCGDANINLIASARYIIQDEFLQSTNGNINTHVVVIVQMPRVTSQSFNGFQVNYL